MSEKEIYIHIGLHKTATTFLQTLVFPNFEEVYALPKPYLRQATLKPLFNKLCYEEGSLFDKNKLIQELATIKSHKVLISDEEFSGRATGFGSAINRSTIALRLKEIFPNAKILLFLRGQESMIYSMYNQYIKGPSKGTLSLQQCLTKGEYNPRGLYIHLNTFKYYELLSLYQSLFEDVKVVLYERFKENPETIIKELESWVGTHSKPYQEKAHEPNITVHYSHIHTVRFINRWQLLFGMNVLTKVAWRMYKYLYVPLTGKGKNDKQYIHKFVEDYYHENNRKLAQLCPELELEKYEKYYPLKTN